LGEQKRLSAVELGSYLLEHLLGGGLPLDIQGQSMAYPTAGAGFRRILNLLCEVFLEVCNRILRLRRSKWFRSRFCA
jgi:hypothetical protein